MSRWSRDPQYFRELDELIDAGMRYEEAAAEAGRRIDENLRARADAIRQHIKDEGR